MTPTIGLLTDFGWRDPYVAAMKAVIAARCEARIIDFGHEIDPGDLFEGAVFLAAVAPYLGPGTIVVAVVDPGVGTERAILAARSGDALFLAPDNGLLSMLPIEQFVRVERDSLFLPGEATTFHGRDRFAPVAAALASGTALESLGPATEAIVMLAYQPPVWGEGSATGTVISIDRFGNVVTDLASAAVRSNRNLEVRVGAHIIRRLVWNYRDGSEGPFIIPGSRRTLEISVSGGSAAEQLQISRFDRVELFWN